MIAIPMLRKTFSDADVHRQEWESPAFRPERAST
jgi:hypothetical protein